MYSLFYRRRCIITSCLMVVVLSTALFAQENSKDSTWIRAQKEMKTMFGQVPNEFKLMPDFMRGTTWQFFKAANNPNSAIPRKYSELIGLAVAAQIPCAYCVYIHTKQAKMFGATDEEIREAVFEGAFTRFMSTIVYGNQQDFVAFKSQWDKILKYIQANNNK